MTRTATNVSALSPKSARAAHKHVLLRTMYYLLWLIQNPKYCSLWQCTVVCTKDEGLCGVGYINGELMPDLNGPGPICRCDPFCSLTCTNMRAGSPTTLLCWNLETIAVVAFVLFIVILLFSPRLTDIL